ncbi:MAG: L-aspartate oxidase [Planctomycetota bacterium]
MTPLDIPRYLVPFDPKRIPHHFADVLIIGGGIAGLRAAMEVDPRHTALIITKDRLIESNSNYAQGGIAGVLDPADDFANHVEDTLEAGAGLCDRPTVEMVVSEGPKEIRRLVEWGTQFDADDDGDLLLGREGGHSHNRIVHALGDATGKEIMRAMTKRARKELGAQVWQNTFSIDLLTTPDDGGAPQCCGALVWNAEHGKTFVWAKQTILATGGAGQVYRETTNPPVATADGHAIAYRAGAELADMEFMQFHPTVLYIAGSSRSLITEALRGEGAVLRDAAGDRFMPGYDERAELAPRDIVSQAIVSQMDKTRHPCVYLDVSHVDADFIRKRFPGIAHNCKRFGIDITTDPIPVRPGAHYMIGGVKVDHHGRTTLPRLWAAGEVTSSGLHGANRLASNSLLEGLVYGARAGRGASDAALDQPDEYRVIPLRNPPIESTGDELDLDDIRNSLQALMWRDAGVWRNEASLNDALTQTTRWSKYVLNRQLDGPAGWELQNLLAIAQAMAGSALLRTESRGVHLRTDFPQSSDEWLRRLTIVRNEAPRSKSR